MVENLNRLIDHTLLKPDATRKDIIKLCNEAMEYDFASICINPQWIYAAKDALDSGRVKVCTVVGFPLGASQRLIKINEARHAAMNGADEIDMVMSIGSLKEKKDEYVAREIEFVREACLGRVLKVIIETCLLTEEEKIRACKICREAGADFIKTSTGFSKGGATKEDVALLKKYSGKMLVKASGGIRTLDDAIAMVDAGADRLGLSASVNIMKEWFGDNDA